LSLLLASAFSCANLKIRIATVLPAATYVANQVCAAVRLVPFCRLVASTLAIVLRHRSLPGTIFSATGVVPMKRSAFLLVCFLCFPATASASEGKDGAKPPAKEWVEAWDWITTTKRQIEIWQYELECLHIFRQLEPALKKGQPLDFDDIDIKRLLDRFKEIHYRTYRRPPPSYKPRPSYNLTSTIP
jgi:hypothetical protein